MQKINLKNQSYQYLEMAFREWLETLGYGQGTVKSLPIIIREFLHFLDTKHIQHINQLQHKHIKHYHDYISIRANERRGGALSNNYINKHLQAIEKFLEFLNHKGNHNVPSLSIKLAKLQQKDITILTIEDIQQLFRLTNKEANTEKEQIINSRDRAMLVIFYSCGLRRNEGVHVCVDDINFDKKIVHVKKGKNYKERFVPLNKTNANYLQEWIYDYRSLIIKSKTQDRLFVNIHGEAMAGGTLYSRLQILVQQMDSEDLQKTTSAEQSRSIGLHTLRHSIATHLLQAGMSLEKIARFLGHSSLESTQIYTHLIC
jgi:integrase/recombinase XerD